MGRPGAESGDRRPADRRRLVPPSAADDVQRELSFHLEMRERELVAEGWEPGEARREALRRFGDMDRVEEACVEIETERRNSRARARGLDELLQDLRFAVRTLGRNPGFTAVAILTLALGIGLNSAVFSVVNGVLLRPLDHPEPHRLVRVDELSERGNPNPVAWPNFLDWRAGSRSFTGMAAYGASATTLQGEAGAERVVVGRVTEDFFPVMQVTPLLGRTFRPEEMTPGAAPVAVISHALWQRLFGGAPALDGLTLRSGPSLVPVVGVLPEGFDFPFGSEAWIPVDPSMQGDSRTAHNWRVVARLAEGASLASAAAEVDALTRRLREVHGSEMDAAGAGLLPLRDALVGDLRRPLLLLLVAAGLVLLVACCNLSSTLLARAANRRREVAIRTALGASRSRVARQLLTETAVLTFAGAVAGLLLSLVLVRALLALAPANLPRADQVAVDLPVLGFTLGISVLTALLFGLLPAVRTSGWGLRDTMDQGGRGGAGGRGHRVWDLLVGGEVALALLLLVGSGLVVRSFVNLSQVDPGFEPRGVLTVSVNLPPSASDASADQDVLDRWGRILPALESLPGVESVGLTSALPFTGQGANGLWVAAAAAPPLEGLPLDDPAALWRTLEPLMEQVRGGDLSAGGDAGYRLVGGDYFGAMGIPLREGRTFQPGDRYDAPHVAVINETMARRHWPGESPVGKRFFTGGMDRWGIVPTEIVGVVADVRHFGPAAEPVPEYFVSALQRPARSQSAILVIRSSVPPESLVSAVRTRLSELAPDVPASFLPMEDRLSRFTSQERFSVLILGAFGVLALILAAIGIYGVVSYAVSRRTREMGIRLALGATPGDVRRLVMRGSMAAVGAGLVVGLLVALNLGPWMEDLLHGVGPRDPATLIAVTAVLLLAAWWATFLPARRGTRVDPIITMRAE